MNLQGPKQRGSWQIFGLLLGIAVLLLILDASGALAGRLDFLREPLNGVTSQVRGLRQVLQRPADLQTAYFEIQVLQQQIDNLQRENEQLREIQGEYTRLVELLDYRQQTPLLTRVTASVVGRGPVPLFRDIIIDKGVNDGVRVGMPVESSRGLVGQVHRAAEDWAQVRLITDEGSSVPGRLTQSRAGGIVNGGGAGGLMTIDWIDLEAQIDVNEVVLTSGFSGTTVEERLADRFPADLVIGRIIEVESGQANLFQSAILQPAVDFDSLEIVFVITDFEKLNFDVLDPNFDPEAEP